MNKDLTTSVIDRQNVLNNPYALAEIEKAAGLNGIVFEGRAIVLKEQVAAFFEVSPRPPNSEFLISVLFCEFSKPSPK